MSWEIRTSGTLALVHKLMFLHVGHIIRIPLAPTEGIIIYLIESIFYIGFISFVHLAQFLECLLAYYVAGTLLNRQKLLFHAFNLVECVCMNYISNSTINDNVLGHLEGWEVISLFIKGLKIETSL